ncbi:MAG: response regulator [Dehalococcoidia bacterium]
MVDRQPGLRYVTIAEDLQRLITEGRYTPGERLPSQHQLARQYGVSLTTLRAAIELLEQGGYVRSEHGLGTFVTKPSSHTVRALVVDDEPAAVHLLRAVLEGDHVEVTGANSKAQALERLGSQEFDVIFLDLVMPGGSGVETLAELHRMGLTPPVVLVTGVADTRMIANAMEYGPLTLIRKPVALSQVRDVLESLRLTAAGRGQRRTR